MHIDDRKLEDFHQNMMDTKDMIAFLEHLDQCNYCLEKMVQQEELRSSTTPSYLKGQILARANAPDVKAVKTVAAASHKIQLLYHGLWTVTGILVALFLLFTVNQIDFTTLYPRHVTQTEAEQIREERTVPRNHIYDFTFGIRETVKDGTEKVNDYLNDFSNKIINGGN